MTKSTKQRKTHRKHACVFCHRSCRIESLISGMFGWECFNTGACARREDARRRSIRAKYNRSRLAAARANLQLIREIIEPAELFVALGPKLNAIRTILGMPRLEIPK